MEQDKQLTISTFLNDVLIHELDALAESKSNYMLFVALGQAIEILGGFLDNKPMKAKGQAKIRFNNAVRYLLGGGYRVHNQDYYLYDKLRNQMVHTFLPSSDIKLVRTSDKEIEKQHLTRVDGQLILVGDVMLMDIKSACARLDHLMKVGKVKLKTIRYE